MWISETVWIDFMLSNPFLCQGVPNPAGEVRFADHFDHWKNQSSTVKKMHSLVSKSGIHRTELHLPHYLMAIACEKHGKSRVLGLSFSITV